jgi:site-specific recombinase XerD
MDSPTIQAAIASFLSGLNTDNTRGSYSTPLVHFCTYLVTLDLDAAKESANVLTVDHAIGFVDWLLDHLRRLDPEHGPKRGTVELYLTAVYRFYRHLLKRGYQVGNADLARLQEVYKDARNVRGESKPKDPKLAIVQDVIRAARAEPIRPGGDPRRRRLVHLRTIAILETLRATGCRIGELVGMTMDNVDAAKHSVQVKGKGSKYRNVYWDDAAWDAVLTYIIARGVVPEGDPVFVGHGNRQSGGPLTTRYISRTIRRLARAAGVKDAEKVTPHYFRHVFATRALERTENLALVQDMLGHKSPVTTRVYAKTNDEQRQTAHAQVWA